MQLAPNAHTCVMAAGSEATPCSNERHQARCTPPLSLPVSAPAHHDFRPGHPDCLLQVRRGCEVHVAEPPELPAGLVRAPADPLDLAPLQGQQMGRHTLS